MQPIVEQFVDAFTTGKISRRELIAAMSGLVVAAAAGNSPVAHGDPAGPTFTPLGLNHIAIRVTDIARSRDFYMKHFGMTVAHEAADNCFLNFEGGFLTLFKGNEARMDHYCYSIRDFDVKTCAAKLREHGIEPDIQGDRIYFPDPDHLTVQLASIDHHA